MVNQLIDHLAWVVAKARMRAHYTERRHSRGWFAKLAAASPDLPRSPHVQAFAPLRCAVFQVVKTAQSRGRTERTLLSAGALAGRDECCGRLDPSLPMSHYGLLHPTHHADKR